MTDFPPVKLPLIDGWKDGQVFVDDNEAWSNETLWNAAQDLPTYDIPLIGMNVDIQPWDEVGDNFLEFLAHTKLIMDADLRYPIILTPAGAVADGRHRLAKAIVLGKTTIKAQRLPFMPDPDYTFDEDGNSTET